ncbi:glycosyltransferase family 2 protein [Alloalcanivorax xenomutans]|uniref:glycosyltransferase family 2 protein n=1 Tax=Alloalcanivorax xenomutans TaxID=1094342 RepID=UPI0013D18BF4
MKVAAVIVTYNRKMLLLETLRGVASQSRPVDRIFLIDNASTDGTAESLEAEGWMEYPKLSYMRMSRNLGGAGGFERGMRLAHQAGYDWIWTMDDDVEPDNNTLEIMLSYQDISQCINATKIFTENGEVQYWEQFYDFATGRLVDLKNVSFYSGREWCPVNVACFEGMLISRELVDVIGFPDPSYFIYHDDTAYGVKASFHTCVIYVRHAVFRKKIYGYGDPNPFRSYYMIRNSFRLKRDSFNAAPVGHSTKFSNFLFFLNLLKYSIHAFRQQPGLKMIEALVKGWSDGIRGR